MYKNAHMKAQNKYYEKVLHHFEEEELAMKLD